MKKVLAFDMDGTLTPSRRPIKPEMAEEIKRLAKKHIIVIVSGGSIGLIKKQILEHFEKIDCYIFATSGSQMYTYKEGFTSEIYKYKLPWHIKGAIFIAIAEAMDNFNIKPVTDIDDVVDDRESQITYSVLGRNADHELKDNFDKNREKRKTYIDWIKLRHPTLLKYLSITIGGTTSIDFVPLKHNKGKALEYLSKTLDIPLDNFIYFGDKLKKGGNDFCVVGYCKCVKVKDDKDLLKKLQSLM